MKKLFTPLFVALMLLLSVNSFAQDGMKKTIVTSLPCDVNTIVILDLNGTVELNEWKKDYIRVVIELKTNIEHEETLSQLVKNGRYVLDRKMDKFHTMMVKSTSLEKEITVNGTALEETMNYKVYVPEYAVVQVLKSEKFVMTPFDFEK